MPFTFKLELVDGAAAEPAKLSAAVPNWGPGDTIHLGRDRTLRVLERRSSDHCGDVLVVEPVRESD